MEDGSAQSLIDFRIIKINRIEWMHIFFSSTYVSIQFKYKCSLFLVGYLVIHALEIGSGCEKSDENTCIYRRRGRLIKLLFSSLDVYIRKRKRLQLALSFFIRKRRSRFNSIAHSRTDKVGCVLCIVDVLAVAVGSRMITIHSKGETACRQIRKTLNTYRSIYVRK